MPEGILTKSRGTQSSISNYLEESNNAVFWSYTCRFAQL